MSKIDITKTLNRIVEKGLSIGFHTSRHPLCVQRTRISTFCVRHGINPVCK